MNREQRAFLETITDTPEDDTPRLIYADWLEEQGDSERAEFIRVQCEVEQMPHNNPRRVVLIERLRQLSEEHGSRFLNELPPEFRQEPVYRRGFVTGLRMAYGQWLAQGDELIRYMPLNELHLREAERHLINLPGLNSLRRIRHLDLMSNNLSDLAAENLTRCAHLQQLQTLDLSQNNLRDEGLAHLLNCEWQNLTSLDLSYNGVSSGLTLLISSPRLMALRVLRLNGNFIQDRGAMEMARTPQMSRLRLLELVGSGVRERGTEALADCSYLNQLQELNLSHNSIRNAGAIALARSRHLSELEALTLWDCDIEREGADALRKRFGDRVLF